MPNDGRTPRLVGSPRQRCVRVTVEAPEQLPPLPAALEVAAYRIALGAINYAERHAGGRTCVVRVALDEAIRTLHLEVLEVADDGQASEWTVARALASPPCANARPSWVDGARWRP
jgi:two-component system, NarL family, sensor kinase